MHSGSQPSSACAYLVGGIPWALIIGRRFYGVDVRKEGSGNLGATNVLRVLGLKAAAATFALDVAKGAVAVGLAVFLVPAADFGRRRARMGDDHRHHGRDSRALVLALHRIQGRQGRRHGGRRAARADTVSVADPPPDLAARRRAVSHGVARLRSWSPSSIPCSACGSIRETGCLSGLPLLRRRSSYGSIARTSCASCGVRSLGYPSVNAAVPLGTRVGRD